MMEAKPGRLHGPSIRGLVSLEWQLKYSGVCIYVEVHMCSVHFLARGHKKRART